MVGFRSTAVLTTRQDNEHGVERALWDYRHRVIALGQQRLEESVWSADVMMQ